MTALGRETVDELEARVSVKPSMEVFNLGCIASFGSSGGAQ